MKKKTFLRTVGKTKSEIMQLWAYVTQCEKSNKYVTVKFPTDVDFLFYNS